MPNKDNKPTFARCEAGNTRGGGSSKVQREQNKYKRAKENRAASRARSEAEQKARRENYLRLLWNIVVQMVARHPFHPEDETEVEGTDGDIRGLTEEKWYDYFKRAQTKLDKENTTKGWQTFEVSKKDKLKLLDNGYTDAIKRWEDSHEQVDGEWRRKTLRLFIQRVLFGNDGKPVTKTNDKGDEIVQGAHIPRTVRYQIWAPGIGALLNPDSKLHDRFGIAMHAGDENTGWGVEYDGPVDDPNKKIVIARFKNIKGELSLSRQESDLVRLLENVLPNLGGGSIKNHTVTNRRGAPSRTFVLLDLSGCAIGDKLAGFLVHILSKVTNLEGKAMYQKIAYWEEREVTPLAPKSTSKIPSRPVGFKGLPTEGDSESESDDDGVEDAAPAPEVDDSCTAVAVPDDADDDEADADEADADDDEVEDQGDAAADAGASPSVLSYASRVSAPPPKADLPADSDVQVQKGKGRAKKDRGRGQMSLAAFMADEQ